MKHLFLPGILLSFLALPALSEQASVGGDDNVGTLPYNGGRASQKAINVAPCNVEEHAGSAVANGCTSGGSVTIKDNGDILCPADTSAVVLTNDRNDTTKIGADSFVESYVAGGTTIIGNNCEVNVHNTHPNQAAPVKVGGSTVYVPPGTTQHFSTVPPPGV